MNKAKCIHVYLPALQETKEQRKMTKRCKKSLFSLEYCLDLNLDTKRYEDRVAEAWNTFFDAWRGKEYDLLLIVASDMIADPNAIDYMANYLVTHEDAHVISGRVERDLKTFKKSFGQYTYSDTLHRGLKDPACLMFKKGVIEKVGRVDQFFPMEFVERDYLYRCKLVGLNWVQLDTPLWYHPPLSGTIKSQGTELLTRDKLTRRLNEALRHYIVKWGGDADREQYTVPLNDLSLDYTYCVK